MIVISKYVIALLLDGNMTQSRTSELRRFAPFDNVKVTKGCRTRNSLQRCRSAHLPSLSHWAHRHCNCLLYYYSQERGYCLLFCLSTINV